MVLEQPNKDETLPKEKTGLNSLLSNYTPRRILKEIQAESTLGYNCGLRLKLLSEEHEDNHIN